MENNKHCSVEGCTNELSAYNATGMCDWHSVRVAKGLSKVTRLLRPMRRKGVVIKCSATSTVTWSIVPIYRKPVSA